MRSFEVPFRLVAGSSAPTRLDVDVVLPGAGTVWVGPLALRSLADQHAGAWWSDRTGGLIGGVAGTMLGLTGAILGAFIARRTHRSLVLRATAVLAVGGLVILTVAVLALASSQPYAVWYPLVLGGGLSMIVFGGSVALRDMHTPTPSCVGCALPTSRAPDDASGSWGLPARIGGHPHRRPGSSGRCDSLAGRMRMLRFRHGERIATGAVQPGSDTVQVIAGTFFEDPLPTGEEVSIDDVMLLAPVLPSKLVCVGKNYAAHAAEFGMEVPDEPLLFLKPSTAVIGPDDPIRLLPINDRTDYEGELAVVIGRLARNVRAEDASRFILGFTCANDVTLRDLQRTDDQWTKAKGFDGSCPLGPWIETSVDPTDAFVETRLNGDVVQRASTSEMVFGVAELIEYITTFMTLLPGDVLLTGTPEGVGRVRARDVVEVEVEGVGTLRNRVTGP